MNEQKNQQINQWRNKWLKIQRSPGPGKGKVAVCTVHMFPLFQVCLEPGCVCFQWPLLAKSGWLQPLSSTRSGSIQSIRLRSGSPGAVSTTGQDRRGSWWASGLKREGQDVDSSGQRATDEEPGRLGIMAGVKSVPALVTTSALLG